MLAKITLYDGTIYRIASKTVDTQDGIYLGRIKDELQLVSQMQEAGNAPATVNLTIINHDNFIPRTKDLWAAELLLTNDNNVSWRGKINFCNFDADGNLYVTASEKTAPELELQLPDEVRQVYTVDEDFHQSSVTMTIPLVVGGTHEKPILVPTILIDKTQGIYLICVGEIREIVAVYNGTERLSLADYGSYRGTAEQVYHKGFAYVAINSGKRLNADGSYAEINVEVVGLKLANFTEEECRNGALFLYYFLTTAATGINGWGCGIDQSEIDTASFQSAITLCNQLGYKLDGIMWLRQSAQSWIDQICQAIHGKYSINANGKRSLFIDYAGNASKKTFTASNMQVDKYGKNSYTSVVYNKGILSYDYNPITGLFMQSAQYENAESIAQIGEQKFVGESYLIKDPTTALAVLEYTCKRSQTAAEAIEFKTDDIDTLLRAGDVITINRPDLSINNALYQIQNISITDYEASISAVKFDTSVFSVTGTASTVNWGSEKAITPALTPAQATNLLLSTGFDINPDGTGIPYISGTFTVPDGGWLAAAVQYGIGTNPSNWTEMALITEGRFKLSPVNVDTVYSIRVRMITATGHSSFITGVITATGDTIPPLKPTISAKATDRTVTIQCGLDTPPADMGGFQIYRKKSTDSESAYTYIGSIAANRGYAAFSDYVDEYVTYNYKAKSYDRSGNLSLEYSEPASVTVTGIQANDVAATALAMPTGSILRLSAKNCTTASISGANGVKDVSGNGNHGQAFGGVSVLDGGEGFEFDGTDDRIMVLRNFGISNTRFCTMSIRFKMTNNPSSSVIAWFGPSDETRAIIGVFTSNNIFYINVNKNEIAINNFYPLLNKEYHVVVVADDSKARLYVDGEMIQELEIVYTEYVAGRLAIGARINNTTASSFSYPFCGNIRDISIYPRALSASEIKTIYMFPDDVTFGQMTADLIGANVIKASNLVYTENIITQTAQIKDAIITNAKIADLNASKINAGTLDAARIGANAITAEKLSVTALSAPSGASCRLGFYGLTSAAAGSYIPDISGNQKKGTIGSTGAGLGADSTYGPTVFFNGTSQYIDIPSLTLANNMSFDILVYFREFNRTHVIFDFRDASYNGLSLALMNDNKLQVEGNGYGTNVAKSTTAISTTSAWHRITVSINNSATYKTKIYLDGVLHYQSTVKTHTTGARIGRIAGMPYNSSTWGYFFVADFSFYPRTLSDAEVKTLYMLGTDTEAGMITADRIAAGCVETRHLTADAIVGKTFQTASNTGTNNAAGVRFNSSGIQGFNGSAKKFDLNTNGKLSCSDVDLTGKITATSGKIGNLSIIDGYLYNENTNLTTELGVTLKGIKKVTSSISYYCNTKLWQGGLYSETRTGSYSGSYKAYVIIDSTMNGTGIASTLSLSNGATAYCANGWSTSCDEAVKRDVKDVSTLAKLKEIRVKKFKYSQKAIQEKHWKYEQTLKAEENAKKGIKTEEEKMPEFEDDENSPDYIMAMAGEFNKTFGVDNGNEESINYTNAIGVALRAIQELAEQFDNAVLEIKELKAKLKIQQDKKLDVEQKEPTSKENLQVENDDTEPITEPVGNSEQLKDGGESEEKK